MLLQDKVAVVTGGTRGIGFATVKRFIEEGAKVAFFGSRKETVDHALEQLAEWDQEAEVMGMYPDLGEPAAITAALAEVTANYGRVDILVNNAGVSASDSLYDYQTADFDRIMKLNVNAAFYCSQAAATLMKAQGGGVILNTSSVVSLYGQPAGVGYPTSKFALNGMTRSLARELGPDHIRVNAVAPGVTDTDMVAALPEDIRRQLAASIPLGRLGTPEDVANAFVFLASDLAAYITGEILSVDGATQV